MSFWKLFFSIIIAQIIADVTYLNLAFFQYDNILYNGYSWISIGKFIVEVLIFGLIFSAIYFLLENFPKWRMRAKYEAAQKEQDIK